MGVRESTVWGAVVGFCLFGLLYLIDFRFGGLLFRHPLVPIEGLVFGAIVGGTTEYIT